MTIITSYNICDWYNNNLLHIRKKENLQVKLLAVLQGATAVVSMTSKKYKKWQMKLKGLVKTMLSGKSTFFFSKRPEVFHVAFKLLEKHWAAFFLAGLSFISEKKHMQKTRFSTKHFNCFLTEKWYHAIC